jgi:DNA-binding response OmpR family regulator
MSCVLIVDSDAQVREVLELLFAHEGWDVLATSRSDEALALAESRPPDVAVCALKLEPFDGPDLIRSLRRVRGAERTDAILFTAASRDDVRDHLGDPPLSHVHVVYKGGDPRAVCQLARQLRDGAS